MEADLSQGLPGFDVVGLPGAAVRESRDCVRAAIQKLRLLSGEPHYGEPCPDRYQKKGVPFMIFPFLALLKASRQLDADLDSAAFLGELSADRRVRALRGVLPMVMPPPVMRESQAFSPGRQLRQKEP